MKTAIFIYEAGQVGQLLDFLHSLPEVERKSVSVLALAADVEFLLEEQGVEFSSARHLRITSNMERVVLAESVARNACTDSSLGFFTYKGISLGKLFSIALQTYLIYLLYYLDIVISFFDAHPDCARVVVFPSSAHVVETSGPLASLEVRVVEIALGIVCARHGAELVLQGSSGEKKHGTMLSRDLFMIKRRLFSLALSLLNLLMFLPQRRKKIRILATDYWKNISPLMHKLPDAELVLLDRTEFFKMDWSTVWKHRMRFMHAEQWVSLFARRLAKAEVKNFSTAWQEAQFHNVAINEAQFRGYALALVLQEALGLVILAKSRRVIELVEGTLSMMKRLQPDIVLVRSSVSAQPHFIVLCEVARILGIPSLELQHGIFYLGPGSIYQRFTAQYVATYGPLVSRTIQKKGHTEVVTIDAGSPRFDAYASLLSASYEVSQKTIVCVAPLPFTLLVGGDTYDTFDFFKSVALVALALPDASVIIKLRPGGTPEFFYEETFRRVFSGVRYEVVRNEPMFKVLSRAWVVVATYTTTVLEALLCGRPLIYAGVTPTDDALSAEFEEYARAGALEIAHSPQQLQELLIQLSSDESKYNQLAKNVRTFMSSEYCSDGHASAKIAEVIRTLVRQKGEIKKAS